MDEVRTTSWDMIRALYMVMLLASDIGLGAGAAWADPVVLYFCDQQELGQDACQGILDSLCAEMADYSMQVAQRPESVKHAGGQDVVPPIVSEVAASTGARFAVWLGVDSAGQAWMHVHDAQASQVLSRRIEADMTAGPSAYEEVAFRLRGLMGASLYTDLQDIVVQPGEDQDQLQALAVPEEKKPILVKVLKPALGFRPWVRIAAGYAVTGYPTTDLWLHGLVLQVSVMPLEKLEVLTDLSLGLGGRRTVAVEPGPALHFRSLQYLVGLGVRYQVLTLGPVAVLPSLGFRLGVSQTAVSQVGSQDHTKLNGGVWGGLDVRIDVVQRFGFMVGARFENLFNHETFRYNGDAVHGLAQFRFAAVAGLCVSL